MAELAGGGILLLIGSSASSGFFIAAGTLGIAKGLYTLFISSSTAIWRKIPRQKISARDDGNGNMTKAIQAKKNIKMYFNLRTVVLALSCIALTIFAIVYYMNLNMSDVSLRVAKMQSGIEDFNPNYIPPDFSLTNIVSENGKITLNFKNHTTGSDFSLIAEQSTWDSNTLLTNFVKHNYSSDYATIHKQGLTIYIDGSNASWISNKVVYKIISNSGSLTKDQICSIATSI